MTRLPRVFIGSAGEVTDIADAIRGNLSRDMDVVLWTEAFPLGMSFSDALQRQAELADFAVFLATPDDKTSSRGREAMSPRDNVIFELGLFSGSLGAGRCYCVQPESVAVKLPSDVLGITTAHFRPDHQAGLASAVGAACGEIRKRVKELGGSHRRLSYRFFAPESRAPGGSTSPLSENRQSDTWKLGQIHWANYESAQRRMTSMDLVPRIGRPTDVLSILSRGNSYTYGRDATSILRRTIRSKALGILCSTTRLENWCEDTDCLLKWRQRL